MYAHEDKKVQLYLCKKIKAKMPNEVDKYIIDSDENMCYVFEQYTKVEVENIKMFVEFIPLDIVNSIATLLSTNTQPYAQTSKHTTQPSQSTNLSEGFDENEPQIPHIECNDNEFHQSDAFQEDPGFNDDNDDDHRNENKDAEEGDSSNVVIAKGINNDTKVLSNYEENSEDGNFEVSSVKEVTTSRLSRYMKGKTFRYATIRKIYLEVRQAFQSVERLQYSKKL